MSNRFTNGWSPMVPHLARSNEVGDLRGDVETAFGKLADEMAGVVKTVKQITPAAPVAGATEVGFDLMNSPGAEGVAVAGEEYVEFAVFDDADLSIPSVGATLDTATVGAVVAGAGTAALKVKTSAAGSFRCTLSFGGSGTKYLAASPTFGSPSLNCKDSKSVVF